MLKTKTNTQKNQNDVTCLAKIFYHELINQPYLTLVEKIKHCGFDIEYFNEHLDLIAFPKWNFQKNCPVICLNVNYLNPTEILEGLFIGDLFSNRVKTLFDNNKSPQNVNYDYILYKDLVHNSKLGSYAIDFANDIKQLDTQK